jgi:hypothetical protein
MNTAATTSRGCLAQRFSKGPAQERSLRGPNPRADWPSGLSPRPGSILRLIARVERANTRWPEAVPTLGRVLQVAWQGRTREDSWVGAVHEQCGLVPRAVDGWSRPHNSAKLDPSRSSIVERCRNRLGPGNSNCLRAGSCVNQECPYRTSSGWR